MEKIPLGLFCAFLIKLAVLGGDLASVAALAVCAALIVSLEFRGKDKKIQAVTDEIALVRSEMKATTDELIKVRSYVTNQKIGTLKNVR